MVKVGIAPINRTQMQPKQYKYEEWSYTRSLDMNYINFSL